MVLNKLSAPENETGEQVRYMSDKQDKQVEHSGYISVRGIVERCVYFNAWFS